MNLNKLRGAFCKPPKADTSAPTDGQLHLFICIVEPLLVQAGEGYWLLTGWSAFSRWRFLSVYLWGEACLACLPYGLFIRLTLQISAFGFDDISDTRYKRGKRCCSKVFVGAQTHGNGVLRCFCVPN